jgi:hypothetical protein
MIRTRPYPLRPARLPLRRFRPIVLLALLLAFARPAAAGSLHPQDGPHAELEIEVGDDRVTVRIGMNLVFLDYLVESHREVPDRIAPSELRALAPRLEEYFAGRCAIEADGVRLRPRIERLARNDPDESLLPLFPRSGLRGLRKIRFELEYPFVPPAREVGVTWTCFPPNELSPYEPKPPLVIAAEFTAEGRRRPIEFRIDEPEFRFHASGGGIDATLDAVPRPAAALGAVVRKERGTRIALVSGLAAVALLGLAAARGGRGGLRRLGGVAAAAAALGAAGLALRVAPATGLPDAAAAREIFLPLQRNLYRAFDYTEERSIYDALARSVDGPLLEDLYLSIRRGLVMEEEGGAVSRVRELRPVEVAVESIGVAADAGGAERPAFTVRCRFELDGRVTHWGHSHDRTIEYLVRYSIGERDGVWKIADAAVIEQRRIDGPETPPAAPETREDGSFEV